MMKHSRAKLNSFLRVAAAGTLVAWLMAVGSCSTECLGEDSHCESAHMNQTAATGSESHGSDKHDNHDDSFCVSLHSICPGSPSSVLAKPDFGLAFTLDFIPAAQLVAFTQPEASISRQPPDDELVFAPEVSLGAAFYSPAPPVLA
jgi:hypothetical protein